MVWTWWCCWKVNNATFQASFCFWFANMKDVLQRQISVVEPWYQECLWNLSVADVDPSIVCSPDPEPRASDGGQDSKSVPPSKQCGLSCYTIQQLESKNYQATDLQTSHQIPRHGCFLLFQVLQRLKVWSEDVRLPCLFLLVLSLGFVLGIILACAFIRLVRAKTHPSESDHCLLTILSCLRCTIRPRMFLKSFYCWSRSNRSCAAQIQNHARQMVDKIQRVYRHPSSVGFRAIPSSSWSPRIIRPLTCRPVIRFPGMAVSLFLRCFRGWKVWSEDERLPCLFLFGTFPCLWSGNNPCLRLYAAGKGENPPFWKPSLPFDNPFLPLRPLVHQAKSSSDHISESCACSSLRKALPLLLDFPLCFPFPLPLLLFTWRPLNGLDCQAHSVSSHVKKHDLSSWT